MRAFFVVVAVANFINAIMTIYTRAATAAEKKKASLFLSHLQVTVLVLINVVLLIVLKSKELKFENLKNAATSITIILFYL